MPSVPAIGSILENVVAPPSTTVVVTGFKVPGFDSPITPGSAPVPVVELATGTVTGKLAVAPNGTYVFTPVAGYSGPVPPVAVSVASSDGQIKDVPLTINVNPLLRDSNEDITVPLGTPTVTVKLLDNAAPPSGATVSVTSFTLPGSIVQYPVGPTSVTIKDPITGTVAGTVIVMADGTATFTPAPTFTGQAPPITYEVTSSDGQTSPGAFTVTVSPALLSDKSDNVATTMGQPVSGNMLDNANLPAGTTAAVTSFTMEGSSQLLTPGTPVALTGPTTGEPVGTLLLKSDGHYTFTPVPDYVGPVPAINVNLRGSNGGTAASSLTIDVLPRKHACPRWSACFCRGLNSTLQLQIDPATTARYGSAW